MQHKTLENGRWAEMAFDRALELIDLTLKYGRQHEPEEMPC